MSRYEDLKDKAREVIFDNMMGEIEAKKHQQMIVDILDGISNDIDGVENESATKKDTDDKLALKADKTLKSPDGTIWERVEEATNEGELKVSLKKVEPIKKEE